MVGVGLCGGVVAGGGGGVAGGGGVVVAGVADGDGSGGKCLPRKL